MKLTLLVGPPGSGKSTLAKSLIYEDGDHGAATVYVNQDSQGKNGHIETFREAVRNQKDIIVDRMNFNKQQRENYLSQVRNKGYQTKIIVLHESYDTCFDRIMKRENHETIKDEENARGALKTFFGHYERPIFGEVDEIEFRYPALENPRKAIIVDIDGTVADCEHRRHFVNPPEGQKKDWPGFFRAMDKDPMISHVVDIVERFQSDGVEGIAIVFCSGRPDDYMKLTKEWLAKTGLKYDRLLMRKRFDSRQDDIVKEIILDFEILTRYVPYFILDDRDQVVKMWRKRGYPCLQVAEGNF